MALQVHPEPATRGRVGLPGWYERGWHVAAASGAVTFLVIAVLQTPRPPLLALTSGLALMGGLMVVGSPGSWGRAWRRFRTAAGLVAVAVLVLVGAGHHLTAALTT